MTMKNINGYALYNVLRTTNSGFSKWGFAEKGGKSHFIKEFIDPIWPVCQDMLDPAMVEHKKQICEEYEQRSKLLYRVINDSSDGNLVRIEDFFRWESHYYLVMEKVDAISLDEGDSVIECECRDRETFISVKNAYNYTKVGYALLQQSYPQYVSLLDLT